MKTILMPILMTLSLAAYAEVPCDIRLGQSIGLKVVEFATGNQIHSKMSIKEVTATSLKEELINLQDEGICDEKFPKKKCVLKLEKEKKETLLTLIRGQDKWFSWSMSAKKQAQDFVKRMQKVGFCS